MRLFLAISMEGAIKEALLSLQNHWKHLGVRGHFVPAYNLHLTMAFIGEHGNPDDVLDATSTVSFRPFNIHLDGAGKFHDTYWVGVKADDALFSCVRQIRHALAESGIPYDRKKFAPHITLVRKANFPGSFETLLKHLPSGSMEVHEILLMRSDRGKNGMIYTPIGRLVPLTGSKKIKRLKIFHKNL